MVESVALCDLLHLNIKKNEDWAGAQLESPSS